MVASKGEGNGAISLTWVHGAFLTSLQSVPVEFKIFLQVATFVISFRTAFEFI